MGASMAVVMVTLKAGPDGLTASLHKPDGPFTVDGRLYKPVEACTFEPDGVGDGKVWHACTNCHGKVTADYDPPRYCPHCGAVNEEGWI